MLRGVSSGATAALDGRYVLKTGDTMTGALVGVAGSRTAASLAVSEVNAGLFLRGTGQLALTSGGNEILFANSAANGGISVGSMSTTGVIIDFLLGASGTLGSRHFAFVRSTNDMTLINGNNGLRNMKFFYSGPSDVSIGTGAAIATTAVSGFLLHPSCAGTPTGVPTNAAAGQIPMIYDTTADKIWFYNGSWRGVAVT